jgi:Tfp pilus assembly protein PilO
MARDKVEKLWIGGGIVAAVAVTGAVWLLAVSPELSDTHNIHSQTSDTRAQNAALEANVTKLQAAYAHIGKLRTALKEADDALPASLALSEFTQQISTQARQNRVSVTTLTAGVPGAVEPPSTTGTTSATPSESTSSTPPSAAGTVPTTGLYSIPISVAVSGKQDAMIDFVRSVQQDGPRAALVSAATLASTPGTTSGTSDTPTSGPTTLTLQMQVFVASDAVAAAGTTPTAAPTGAASTTP